MQAMMTDQRASDEHDGTRGREEPLGSRAIVPLAEHDLLVADLAERALAMLENEIAATVSSVRVLVVDDIRETREYLARRISQEADLVVAGLASTGLEALEVAPRLRPDVVLMDVLMPDMDGITATEILLTRMPWVGVTIMSILDDDTNLRRAMLAGASEYLVKPFTSEELFRAIRDVAQRAAARKSRG